MSCSRPGAKHSRTLLPVQPCVQRLGEQSKGRPLGLYLPFPAAPLGPGNWPEEGSFHSAPASSGKPPNRAAGRGPGGEALPQPASGLRSPAPSRLSGKVSPGVPSPPAPGPELSPSHAVSPTLPAPRAGIPGPSACQTPSAPWLPFLGLELRRNFGGILRLRSISAERQRKGDVRGKKKVRFRRPLAGF